MLGRPLVVGTLLLAVTGCGAATPVSHKLLWAGAPARFRPAAGWHVRTTGPAPVADGMETTTVAGTVPWRGELELAPPERALRALRARHGIEIYVQLEAGKGLLDGRHPTTSLHLTPVGAAFWGEGPAAPGLSAQTGAFLVARQYVVGVDVIYGGRHPTRAQRTEMRAELARLVLPARWPRWWRG